jgi:hypothetical protein
MQKEKLTLGDIRTDLHTKIKIFGKRIALLSVLFLVMLGLLLADFPLGGKWLLGAIAEVILLAVAIDQIRIFAMLCRSVKAEPCIVKDTLLNAEVKDRYSRKFIDDKYRLHFAKYGSFVIPVENYKWSAAFEMDAKGVFHHSCSGDEFYLVLSKAQGGKILLAYNTKLFDLEEQT